MAAGISIPGLTVNSNGGGLQPGGSISFGNPNQPGAFGPALPINSQQVLPASTFQPPSSGGSSGGGGVSGGQQKQNGGWYNGQQYWAPGQGPQSATSSQSSTDQNLPTIDSLFSGQMGYLEGLKPQLNQDATAATGAVNQQFTGQQQSIQDQLSGLNKQLGLDTTNYNQNIASSYSQAQNQYNQLLQRNLAMYGGGSSAGPAISAILGQGYQQQTGQMANENTQGQQQLGMEGQNISQWGDTQNNQLSNWKNEALNQVNLQLQQGLDSINQQEGQTEDAKTQAKLGLLQQVIAQRSALDTYHAQLQNQMAVIQAMNGGQMGLSSYNPGNYAANIQNVLGNVGQTSGQLAPSMLGSAGLQHPQQVASGLGLGSGFVPGQQQQQQNQNDIFGTMSGLPGSFGQ